MSNRSHKRPASQPAPCIQPPKPISAINASALKSMAVAPPYRLCSARHGLMLVNENDQYMGQAFLKYGECCESELAMLMQLIRFPGLVIEVGANMGIFAVPLAAELQRQGRTMMVFEPQPVIFQQLCANLALNGLLNVTALPYACGATAGVVSFAQLNYRSPNNFGNQPMTLLEGLGPEVLVQTVPCVTLDDLVPSDHVGLIKIDVEGQERLVLEGATAILARSQPMLYVENDQRERSSELIHWLWDHGYEMWWHTPRLFEASNYFGEQENIYGTIGSFNMLCLPASHQQEIEGVEKITNADAHPMRQ